MTFTKEQLSELICKHAERENDLSAGVWNSGGTCEFIGTFNLLIEGASLSVPDNSVMRNKKLSDSIAELFDYLIFIRKFFSNGFTD